MKDFIYSVLSNSDGSGSSNRVCLMLVLLFILGSATFITIQTGAIPDVSQAWIYLVGIFVGGTTASKGVDAFKTNTEQPQPEQAQ